MTARSAAERGATVVETLAVMLLSIAALMVLIQMSLWLWARNVTLNAADEGARAAAEMGRPLATGETRTRSVLHDGLGNAARGFQVVATQDGNHVTVHARGVAPRIVPFLPAFAVSADAEAFDEDQVMP